MIKTILQSITLLVLFSLLTGVAYPLIVTGAATAMFPKQARGSVVQVDGKPAGSLLIGQAFDEPRYIWGRLSATSPVPYNAAASSGSNLGPTNPALLEQVNSRIKALRDADPENHAPIPADLVTASGSGLDPDISPAAAAYQAPRVARARGLPEAEVLRLIEIHITPRQWGVLGEPRVNVLQLNLALDRIRR